MMRAWPGLLLLAALINGCGDETAVLVEVDVSAFAVPDEVDRLHLELRDEGAPLIGREFVLEEDLLIYRLLPGPRTPSGFYVKVYAYLAQVWVAESEMKWVRFKEGETKQVTLVVPRP
jgi:hypothetical protein